MEILTDLSVNSLSRCSTFWLLHIYFVPLLRISTQKLSMKNVKQDFLTQLILSDYIPAGIFDMNCKNVRFKSPRENYSTTAADFICHRLSLVSSSSQTQTSTKRGHWLLTVLNANTHVHIVMMMCFFKLGIIQFHNLKNQLIDFYAMCSIFFQYLLTLLKWLWFNVP